MKRVVLVRHAKAVAYGYDDDFNRDLRESGIVDAQRVSNELKKRGIIPDRIISSPARRALKTAQIFAETLGFEPQDIRKSPEIYEGLSITEFIDGIKTQPKEAKTVFFFGHNPDFNLFVQNLLTKYNLEMPTCTTVVIDFDVEIWEKVEPRTGKLVFQLIPKEIS